MKRKIILIASFLLTIFLINSVSASNIDLECFEDFEEVSRETIDGGMLYSFEDSEGEILEIAITDYSAKEIAQKQNLTVDTINGVHGYSGYYDGFDVFVYDKGNSSYYLASDSYYIFYYII